MAFSVAVDTLIMGPGLPVPGDIVRVGPPSIKRGWDVKPGFGIEGAFCVYKGSGLATFDVMCEFWNEASEPAWDRFAKIILQAPGTIQGVPTPAISIYHPILVKPPFLIQNVVVTEVEGWKMIRPGHWTTRFTCLEFKKRKEISPSKTEPVVPAPEKKPVETPKTAQDFRMKASADRLERLTNRRPPRRRHEYETKKRHSAR